jgi:hypothetical protein
MIRARFKAKDLVCTRVEFQLGLRLGLALGLVLILGLGQEIVLGFRFGISKG